MSNCQCRKVEDRKFGLVLTAVVSGLLASSCCVVQLLLNALSLGCAGFSLLTPYKPWFRALCCMSVGQLVWRNGLNRRVLATCAISAFLMVSEELLSMYNTGAVGLILRTKLLSIAGRQQPALPGESHTHVAYAEKTDNTELYQFLVEGVKCEGCALRLKQYMLQQPGVRDCNVYFANKSLDVWVNSREVRAEDVLGNIQRYDSKYLVQKVVEPLETLN